LEKLVAEEKGALRTRREGGRYDAPEERAGISSADPFAKNEHDLKQRLWGV